MDLNSHFSMCSGRSITFTHLKMNQEYITIAITIVSALAAIASALYAFLQVREARNSAARSEESVKEAFVQNRINALIVLKEHLERELPRIKAIADRFATPETQDERRALDAEHDKTRKKLQRVGEEIENLYEVYIPTKK